MTSNAEPWQQRSESKRSSQAKRSGSPICVERAKGRSTPALGKEISSFEGGQRSATVVAQANTHIFVLRPARSDHTLAAPNCPESAGWGQTASIHAAAAFVSQLIVVLCPPPQRAERQSAALPEASRGKSRALGGGARATTAPASTPPKLETAVTYRATYFGRILALLLPRSHRKTVPAFPLNTQHIESGLLLYVTSWQGKGETRQAFGRALRGEGRIPQNRLARDSLFHESWRLECLRGRVALGGRAGSPRASPVGRAEAPWRSLGTNQRSRRVWGRQRAATHLGDVAAIPSPRPLPTRPPTRPSVADSCKAALPRPDGERQCLPTGCARRASPPVATTARQPSAARESAVAAAGKGDGPAAPRRAPDEAAPASMPSARSRSRYFICGKEMDLRIPGTKKLRRYYVA
ncbi:uncharacterized protein LOC119530246 [Choloepus didactylus]|uniref:uncharacterized protein LOC119530246 n=1 Tax=Choloepus didactylus TaxID=27675 RepID=UPI00189C6F7D|nr:uncharacterized protein LOC119530246 [Choloepus didactylus]